MGSVEAGDTEPGRAVVVEVSLDSNRVGGRGAHWAYRDVRAAKFHPLDPELTLVHAGRLALGMPADRPHAWGL